MWCHLRIQNNIPKVRTLIWSQRKHCCSGWHCCLRLKCFFIHLHDCPSESGNTLIHVMSPQTADQLLARADAAKALAEEAAQKGNGTLQEANTILSNLKGKEEALGVNPSIPV